MRVIRVDFELRNKLIGNGHRAKGGWYNVKTGNGLCFHSVLKCATNFTCIILSSSYMNIIR